MTKISTDTVEYLAKLSKLSIDPGQLSDIASDLSKLVQYVDKLEEVATDTTKPTYQVTGLTNIMRADEVIDYGTTQDDLLKNVDKVSNDLIKTPKALGS